MDATGRGVSGALVIFTGFQGNPYNFTRISNSSGYLRIIDYPGGSFIVNLKVKRRINTPRIIIVNEVPNLVFTQAVDSRN